VVIRKEYQNNSSTNGTKKRQRVRDLLSETKTKKRGSRGNHIEGKFGQGENGYNLNEIRARLKNTSESWISCIFFIMNLILYEKGFIFGSILEKVNSMCIKIIERAEQIMMLFISKKGCLFKKLKIEYLLS